MPLLLAAAVPVLAWDHHVHDSLGKSNRVDKESGQPSRLLWDGSKKSQVAEELQKKPSGKEASQALIQGSMPAIDSLYPPSLPPPTAVVPILHKLDLK